MMHCFPLKWLLILLLMAMAPAMASAQIKRNLTGELSGRLKSIGQINTGSKDSSSGFKRRDDRKDSITIYFTYFDSTNRRHIDSSVNDFDTYFSVPSNYLYLGNNGAAAYPLIFQPNYQPGWDPGFHAFDIYRSTIEGTKLYRTTRPFSELDYQLASGKEQMIKAIHTQNPKPNLNFGFDYRMISAPGFFISQNNNHNSYRLYATYQGKKKRFNSSLIIVGNSIRASQNGGIINDSLLRDINHKDRFSIDVNLANRSNYSANPFSTKVNTGNIYKDFNLLFRNSYDLGKKDSLIINDSTTEYLFYSKLRIQHTFRLGTFNYRFTDQFADSALYHDWFHIQFDTVRNTYLRQEDWVLLSNDFSLYSFPETRNPTQFIRVGVTTEQIRGTKSDSASKMQINNLMVHGEYRNRTRNRLWDVLLKGEFYLGGSYSGDYMAYGKINRYLNKGLGNISIFFRNTNRTPSFVFDGESGFNLSDTISLKKENIISFGAVSENKFATLSFTNHLINNYSYFTDYIHKDQYNKPINLIQISASKKIRISKRWYWYSTLTFQQTDGAAPIHVPLLYTRNSLAFEGTYFKNLLISTGIELRYFTPFKANNFSPITAQFFPQNQVTIKNLPDIAAFVHFRIKAFTLYVRGENLNTVNFADGFSFTNNNFAAPHYPTQGFMLRLGIKWWFVN